MLYIALLFQQRKEIAILRIRQSLCKVIVRQSLCKVIVKIQKDGRPKRQIIFQSDCVCTEVIPVELSLISITFPSMQSLSVYYI